MKKSKKVCDYWIKGKGWNWKDLKGLLPNHVENELAGKVIIEEESIEDTTCWSLTNSGRFSVKSVYDLITDNFDQMFDSYWKAILEAGCTLQIRAFLWKVSHGKLMSNSKRVKRRFASDSHCGLCQNSIEDVEHIFRKCKEASKSGAY